MAAPDLAALLTHPLLRLGLPQADIARRAALLELALLRSRCAAGSLAESIAGDPAALLARAREEASGRFAHPAKQRISEKDWDDLHDLLIRLGAQFAPLLNVRGEVSLDRWVTAHRQTIEAIASAEEDGEDREALDTLYDELAQNHSDRMIFDVESYGLFFAAVAGEIILRGGKRVHPASKSSGFSKRASSTPTFFCLADSTRPYGRRKRAPT